MHYDGKVGYGVYVGETFRAIEREYTRSNDKGFCRWGEHARSYIGVQ